ncbi:MAG TPA: DUF4157 domain-containing protein [Allosphingosinicella sp.]
MKSDTPAAVRRMERSPAARTAAPAPTSLPEPLKSGAEALGGFSLADVKVHRDSPEPAELGALAFTRGGDIHLATGQELHLPHETWHAVQQKQGRVSATAQVRGQRLNGDDRLEAEADRIGSVAAAMTSTRPGATEARRLSHDGAVVQRRPRRSRLLSATIDVKWSENEDQFYDRVLAALARSAEFAGLDSGTYNSASATEHMLYDLVRAFRSQYHEAFGRRPKPGEAVKLHLEGFYDAGEATLVGKKVSFVSDAARTDAPRQRSLEAPSDCGKRRDATETDIQRETREIDESSCFIAREILTGALQNAASVSITLTSAGTFPAGVSFAGSGEPRSKASPIAYAEAYRVAREAVETFHVATSHTPSTMTVDFSLAGGVTMMRQTITPLPADIESADPVEGADDGECLEEDIDYGECIAMERSDAYREGIAAAEEEFKRWYDPYNLSGDNSGLPPRPPGKFPKGIKPSKVNKLRKINKAAPMAMKEIAGKVHGIRGRLRGQAIAVVEVQVGTTVRYAAGKNSGSTWSRRQTNLLNDLGIEKIPSHLSESVHAEANVRAWVQSLERQFGRQNVRVKRWGISAGRDGKFICGACREIARQVGGIIETF